MNNLSNKRFYKNGNVAVIITLDDVCRPSWYKEKEYPDCRFNKTLVELILKLHQDKNRHYPEDAADHMPTTTSICYVPDCRQCVPRGAGVPLASHASGHIQILTKKLFGNNFDAGNVFNLEIRWVPIGSQFRIDWDYEEGEKVVLYDINNYLFA